MHLFRISIFEFRIYFAIWKFCVWRFLWFKSYDFYCIDILAASSGLSAFMTLEMTAIPSAPSHSKSFSTFFLLSHHCNNQDILISLFSVCLSPPVPVNA